MSFGSFFNKDENNGQTNPDDGINNVTQHHFAGETRALSQMMATAVMRMRGPRMRTMERTVWADDGDLNKRLKQQTKIMVMRPQTPKQRQRTRGLGRGRWKMEKEPTIIPHMIQQMIKSKRPYDNQYANCETPEILCKWTTRSALSLTREQTRVVGYKSAQMEMTPATMNLIIKVMSGLINDLILRGVHNPFGPNLQCK